MSLWGDDDKTFATLYHFRRQMDRILEDFEKGWGMPVPGLAGVPWPRTNMVDTGAELVLQVEVPGLSQKDLQISATQAGLTLSGARKADVPEGYAVHRQERGQFQFSRNFTLPCKVDVEKISATVKNGLLTVTMAKAAEAQPRRITVRAS